MRGVLNPDVEWPKLQDPMMVIALCHDISLPLVLFCVYNTRGLIGCRMLNKVCRAATDPSLLLTTVKGILLFVFVLVSFPLLTLRLAEIGPFYGSLLGIR